MYSRTVGQIESREQLLAKAKQTARSIYEFVQGNCLTFVNTRSPADFISCFQNSGMEAKFGYGVSAALKIYLLGKKLNELEPFNKASEEITRKYALPPVTPITPSEWAKTGCNLLDNVEIGALRDCYTLYPGPAMSWEEFFQAWSTGH